MVNVNVVAHRLMKRTDHKGDLELGILRTTIAASSVLHRTGRPMGYTYHAFASKAPPRPPTIALPVLSLLPSFIIFLGSMILSFFT